MMRESLGPYVLDRELGSGGMGTVYRATFGDAVVAVKVIHPHLLESSDAVERFRREIEIGKTVRHPNVVRTLDGGEWAGRHYLAMEYVEGQTLEDLLRELERVPEQLCRHIGCEVAKGLAAVHDAGAIHRDIKPENILITPDHVVKIMDLGVARMVDDLLRLSKTGAFVGSLRYAAPECFRQVFGSPDHRADLHGLGLVLYELATGEAPYAAPDVHGSILRVMEEIPRRIGEVNPQLSPFFEEVVHTLLVKDPRGRFASASKLLAALAPGEDGQWWRARASALRVATRRPLRRIRIPRETALYGRTAELAILRNAFEEAVAGDGQLLMVEGEAGIGKSRLVDEFVGQLQRDGIDFNFVFGGYPPGGAATASGAFTTAFSEQFGSVGSAAYLPDNQVLVPAFDALLRGDTTPVGAERLDRTSLQACFVRATQTLSAERMTIVLIDDLHFAPEEGRALFASLALGTSNHCVLLIGTMREGLPEDWLAGLSRLDHSVHLMVPRLGPKDLVRLLSDAFSSERLAVELGAKIALKTDGNPFFVFETLRSLRDGDLLKRRTDGTWGTTRTIERIEIPSSVRDLVNARVSTLSSDDRDVLDAACCWGFEFDPGLLAQVIGIAPISLFKQLARIERAHRLIRASGRKFVFDHHQVQEALYSTLPEVLREEYHAALADALESQANAVASDDPGALDGPLSDDLCTHFLKGAKGARAVRYLDAALLHLRDGYLNARAVALADLALAVPRLLTGRVRANILLKICDGAGPLGSLGQRARQEDGAREAERLAEEVGDESLRLQSAMALYSVFARTGRPEEAEAAARRALEIAIAEGDRRGEATATAGIGFSLQSRGRLEEARAHYATQRDLCREVADREGEAHAMNNLGAVSYTQGLLEDAGAKFRSSLVIQRELGDRRAVASLLGSLGVVLHASGRVEEAREYHLQHLERSAEVGNRFGESAATGNLGVAFLARGRLAEARQYCERHLELSREIGNRAGEAIATLNLGVVFESQGRIAEAREFYERHFALSLTIGNRQGEAMAHHNLARAEFEEGNFAEAASRYAQCLAICEETGDRYIAAATHLGVGSMRAHAGEEEDAVVALRLARDLAAENGFAGVEVLALCELALLPGGDVERAEKTFAEKAELVESKERVEAHFLLWRATDDRAYLVEAKRRLDEAAARVDVETRELMLTKIRVNRAVVLAFETAFEDPVDGDTAT